MQNRAATVNSVIDSVKKTAGCFLPKLQNWVGFITESVNRLLKNKCSHRLILVASLNKRAALGSPQTVTLGPVLCSSMTKQILSKQRFGISRLRMLIG